VSLERITAMTARTLLWLATITLTPATLLADDCDCSCPAFAQLETEVALFERQLDEGRTALVTPALQSHLQCMTPCAESWTQCAYATVSDPAITQTHTGADASTATAGVLDSGDPKDW
jgi:hypothetical protein